MPLTLDDLVKATQVTEKTKKGWALMRLDDNGNEFEMALFEDLEAAEVARRTYQARGHKQTYFLQKK